VRSRGGVSERRTREREVRREKGDGRREKEALVKVPELRELICQTCPCPGSGPTVSVATLRGGSQLHSQPY